MIRRYTTSNIAPAIKKLRAQIDASYPRRSKSSDGIWPSPAHDRASPTSAHRAGNAVDITDNLGGGHTVDSVVRAITNPWDARLEKVIHNNRVYEAGGSRVYGGINPHKTHAHIEVKESKRRDSRPWKIHPGPLTYPGRVMRRGDKGAWVTWVQKRLRHHGYDVAVDGTYGAKTYAAVKRFKYKTFKARPMTGNVGPNTWKALAK